MQLTNQLVALYARLSKDRSGLSENVQIQLREGTYFVEDNGGQVVASFTDNDISASKFSKKPRPEYDLLVAAIERGEVEVIVVTEMTRLYRRIEELLELIKMAEHTKLRGIFTTDGIGYDLSTPEGVHAAIGAVNNAMLESARLSKRQKRKKKARAEQGRYLGGYRAYGYEGALKDEAGTVLNRGRINVALIDREVEIYRDCVRRIIAGERAMTIMRDLNQRGVPSPDGKQWAAGNFKRLFMKKRYVVFEAEDQPATGQQGRPRGLAGRLAGLAAQRYRAAGRSGGDSSRSSGQPPVERVSVQPRDGRRRLEGIVTPAAQAATFASFRGWSGGRPPFWFAWPR
jgi:DNA invertase Pin-like site-specific DNA recombinase